MYEVPVPNAGLGVQDGHLRLSGPHGRCLLWPLRRDGELEHRFLRYLFPINNHKHGYTKENNKSFL